MGPPGGDATNPAQAMPRARKTKVQTIQPVINPHAAGADIGAREIYVAPPSALTNEPVRSFPTFTEDLRALVAWLQSFGIKSVAMEATSVYWIPLAELLEEAKIEVCLVNPRHVKNVPGRKTDVMDCQWLQYLHSVGLLRGAFRPAAEVRGPPRQTRQGHGSDPGQGAERRLPQRTSKPRPRISASNSSQRLLKREVS